MLFVFCVYAEPVEYAYVAVLDKVTTKVWIALMKVGGSVDIRRLKISMHACDAPPPSSFNQDHARCFLEISDSGVDNNPQVVFSRWMFVNYASVAALDHKRYDVWLVSCGKKEIIHG